MKILAAALQPVVAGGLGHYRDHSPDAKVLSIFELQLEAALAEWLCGHPGRGRGPRPP